MAEPNTLRTASPVIMRRFWNLLRNLCQLCLSRHPIPTPHIGTCGSPSSTFLLLRGSCPRRRPPFGSVLSTATALFSFHNGTFARAARLLLSVARVAVLKQPAQPRKHRKG